MFRGLSIKTIVLLEQRFYHNRLEKIPCIGNAHFLRKSFSSNFYQLDFQIEGVSETFKKGLNFYGTAKVLREKRQEFHIYYDSSSNTLMADIHLPYYQALSPDGKKKYPLIFKRNNMDDKIEGGNRFINSFIMEVPIIYKPIH